MTGIPKDERGYEHLVARADTLLGHARSAVAGDRREPALLGLRSVLALIGLTRAEGAAPAPPTLKGHLERIERGAERELARLDPTFVPTLPPRERPVTRAAAARAAAPARRAPGAAAKPRATKAAPARVLTAAQAVESTDARALLSAVTSSASPADRRLLMDRLAEIAVDPALLSANDAASVPGALRHAQPTVAELAPIVAALMSRQDLRRSKPVLQHLGELCLDRGAVDEAGTVLAELQDRFPGDMVVRKLLSRRDELA